MAGKTDKRRPTDIKKYDKNFMLIKWRSKKARTT